MLLVATHDISTFKIKSWCACYVMCRYLLFVIVLSLTIHYSNIIWDRRKPSRWLRRSVSAWRKLGQFVQAGEGSHHQRFCLLVKSVISFFRASPRGSTTHWQATIQSIALSMEGSIAWNNGNRDPSWGVAEIQKMSTPRTAGDAADTQLQCYQTRESPSSGKCSIFCYRLTYISKMCSLSGQIVSNPPEREKS